MTSTKGEPSTVDGAWQSKAWTQLLALAGGVLPLYAGTILLQLRRAEPLSVQGFIFYLAVIAPVSIVVALVLLRFLCGEKPSDLNLNTGRLSSDMLAALVLSLAIIVANVVSTSFLSGLIPDAEPNTSVRLLFLELTRDLKLMVLFMGPLIFLGAASEEVIRVFLLSRLWKVWPTPPAKSVAVIISAVLFGLSHLYQGPIHVVWTGIYGVITALYYLRFGRVVPLILAHYVTNAIQVVAFATLAR